MPNEGKAVRSVSVGINKATRTIEGYNLKDAISGKISMGQNLAHGDTWMMMKRVKEFSTIWYMERLEEVE